MAAGEYHPIGLDQEEAPAALRRELEAHERRRVVAPPRALLGLAALGLGLAGYMAVEYYRPEHRALCDLTATVSCTELARKGWATLLGVPIAVLGLVWFGVLFFTQLLAQWTQDGLYALAVLVWAGLGAAFIVYLVAVEVAVGVLCPVCTAVHVVLLAVLGLAVSEFRRYNNGLPLRFVPSTVSRQLPLLLSREPLFLTMVAIVNVTPFIAFNAGRALSDTEEHWSPPMKVALAHCLHNKHALMYGSAYCGHCAHQKALFGEAIHYLDFLDCEDPELRPRCTNATLIGYPTWVMYDEDDHEAARHIGMMPLSRLASWSGCHVPKEQPPWNEESVPDRSVSST